MAPWHKWSLLTPNMIGMPFGDVPKMSIELRPQEREQRQREPQRRPRHRGVAEQAPPQVRFSSISKLNKSQIW